MRMILYHLIMNLWLQTKQINVTVGDNGKFIVSGAKTSTKYHFLNCIVKD